MFFKKKLKEVDYKGTTYYVQRNETMCGFQICLYNSNKRYLSCNGFFCDFDINNAIRYTIEQYLEGKEKERIYEVGKATYESKDFIKFE